MWRIFSIWQIVMWRKSPHEKLLFGEMFPHGKYGEKYVIWRNVETNLSCGEICPQEKRWNNLFCHNLCCFVEKLVLLPFTLFCRNLRVFAWREIEPKIVSVEKKGQISGMTVAIYWQLDHQLTSIWGVSSLPFEVLCHCHSRYQVAPPFKVHDNKKIVFDCLDQNDHYKKAIENFGNNSFYSGCIRED